MREFYCEMEKRKLETEIGMDTNNNLMERLNNKVNDITC
jgi:hypothetical protein